MELVQNRKLFEIIKDVQAYEELLIENAIDNEGEISPELEIWEQEFFTELGAKTDRTVEFIRYVESEAERFKKDEELFRKKRKSLENLVEKTKKYVKQMIQYNDVKVLPGERYKITLANNGGKPALEFMDPYKSHLKTKSFDVFETDFIGIPERYFKLIRVLDKDAIRDDLSNGLELGIATLMRGQSIRIS